MSRRIHARVPTLPTPTTFRAMSTNRYLRMRWRNSGDRDARYSVRRLSIAAASASPSAPGARSRSGTTRGGSLLMRAPPRLSPTTVRRLRARRLSLWRACAIPRRALSTAAPVTRPFSRFSSPAASTLEYQTSMSRIAAMSAWSCGTPRPPRRRGRRGHGRRSRDGVRDRQARRQALDVPLPRCGERLVEVVEVEHQAAVRRGEEAEVRRGGHPRTPAPAAPRPARPPGRPPSRPPRRGRRRTASPACARAGSARARGPAPRPPRAGSPQGPSAPRAAPSPRATSAARRGGRHGRAPRARPPTACRVWTFCCAPRKRRARPSSPWADATPGCGLAAQGGRPDRVPRTRGAGWRSRGA